MTNGAESLKHSYWLTRIVLLRSLAAIYGVAFLVAYNQNGPLIGSRGLLPAHLYLTRVHSRVPPSDNSPFQMFIKIPTLLWWTDFQDGAAVERFLELLSIAGLLVSAFVTLIGSANAPIMAALWLMYGSIVNVGQTWYSFGWESQLLETGFLAIFLVPTLSLSRLPASCPPSRVVIWAYRWLIFRIMLGAGLIKMRGDRCWRDLTCMHFHYETQPVPNPLAFYLHKSPSHIHALEVIGNHFVELVAPFAILIPWRPARLFAGITQILFQVMLILSGNLSFLNWLTILPSLCLFNDAFYSKLFSHKMTEDVISRNSSDSHRKTRRCYNVVHVCLGVGIAYLSIPVVSNLLSQSQMMNTSFDSFRVVNTYGAFGSITKERTEVVIEGTHSGDLSQPGVEWVEYQFHCKPGHVGRRPCVITPYHYRLDWLMWFAAFQNYQHNPWLVHLAGKLLMNDSIVHEGLISHNPFQDRPPKYIRMQHYRYRYADSGSAVWWVRELKGSYMPPVRLQDLTPFLKHNGWPVEPQLQGQQKIGRDEL